MLNKTGFLGLIITAGLLASFSQVAAESSPPPASNSHFYTSALIGYSSMNVKNKESVFVNNMSNEVKNYTYNSNGTVGTLLVGYRNILDNNYLVGLEFGLSFDNNSIDKTENIDIYQTKTKLKGPYKFTPALVLGNQFAQDWLAFIKLGVSISRFEIKHSIASLPQVPINGASNTIHTTRSGFMGAIGLEHSLTKELSAVGLVSYENFGKMKYRFTSVIGAPAESNTIILRPEYYTVKVGMTYKF